MKPNKNVKLDRNNALNDKHDNLVASAAESKPNLVVKGKIKKPKAKQDKKKLPKDELETAPVPATLSQTDAAKIEKKKAKKLAKKLKKEQTKKEDSKNQLSTNKEEKKAANQSGKEPHKRDPALDASTVFVGNLPVTTKRVQIVKLFAKFGGVKSIRLRTAAGQVIFKHKQRKQAGSLNAYVVLNSPEDAQRSLELNGQQFKEFHLRVTPSDLEKNRKEHDPKRTVFVGNLKYTANEEKLRDIFSNCGEISYIRCLYDGKNKCKGVGYVCFKSPEAVGLALELNETLLDERPIHVERYSTKKLGAKEARDKVEKKAIKSGAKKRIDSKQRTGDSKNKKNSEFRGVKVSDIKKKNKKKVTLEMKNTAKKIAPLVKT